MEVPPSSSSSHDIPYTSSDNHRLYLVPFRWWNEADVSCDPDGETTTKKKKKKRGVLYDVLPTSSSYAGPMKILNIFKSDLAFNLVQKEKEDDGLEDNGRSYALVSDDMWLRALKWHSDVKGAAKDGKSSAAEDDMADVYPLQLKLSILQESNTLGVRISKKDNAVECFRRACKIFSIEPEVLHILDFSGQTTQFLLNDKNKNIKDSPRQSEQDWW